MRLAATFIFSITPLFAGVGRADEPVAREAIPTGGLSLPRPAGLPDRLYGGEVYTTGGDRGHVIIHESADVARPARWLRLDDQGRILWEADHRCPDFRDYTMLVHPEGQGPGEARAVCKVGRQVIGVDLDTGREAWAFTEPRPLYMTVRAGDRVAVSVDNEHVAVLDVMTGKEVLRFDVAGAVLEAATSTTKGPVAFLVADSPGKTDDYIELPIGEGDALEKVPLAGDDPGRRLVALPIGGPPRKGILKPKLLWSVPFAGWSYDLEPTAGALIGEPTDGRITAYDLADGRVLWERPEVTGEVRSWGDGGGVFARPLAGGGILFGALDGRLGKMPWDRQVDTDQPPLGVGTGDGDMGVVWSTGFRLADYATGRELLARDLVQGEQLVALRSTPRSAAWVVVSGDSRSVHFASIRD